VVRDANGKKSVGSVTATGGYSTSKLMVIRFPWKVMAIRSTNQKEGKDNKNARPSRSHSARSAEGCRASSSSRCRAGLSCFDEPVQVAFAVLKPGSPAALRGEDAADGLEIRKIVFFENHPPGFQLGYLGFDIVGLPA
jgi:hypothetical protein